MYYPGVSLAVIHVCLEVQKRQDLILTVPASELVGPNAEAETLIAIIFLGNRRIWDYSFVRGVGKKYKIVDELKLKIIIGAISALLVGSLALSSNKVFELLSAARGAFGVIVIIILTFFVVFFFF